MTEDIKSHGFDPEMRSLTDYYGLVCFFLLMKHSMKDQNEIVKNLISKSKLVELNKGEVLYAWDTTPEQ